MTDNLLELDDPDLVPEILPATATLALTGPTDALRTLFARASAVAPLTAVVPGTQYALLQAFAATTHSAAFVQVTATDGELVTSVRADGIEVAAPGQVLVPPKSMVDRLRLAPTDTATITVVDDALLLRAGRARWTVPVPPEVDPAALALLRRETVTAQRSVDVAEFRRALKVARLAASTTNARTSLMQVEVRNGHITGCDGGRLHRATVASMDPGVEMTIPVRVVDELLKALEGTAEERLWLGSDGTRLVFDLGGDLIVGHKLLLPYPDLQNLVMAPSLGNTRTLVVERDELEYAVRRVRVSADPDLPVVVLALVPSGPGWKIELRAKDHSGNAATEAVSAQWDGPARSVMFNHKHLLDVLSAVPSGPVALRLGDDTKSTRHPLLVETSGATLVLAQVVGSWLA